MSMFCLSCMGKVHWSGARAPSPPRKAGAPSRHAADPCFGCRDACCRHGPGACQVPGCLYRCLTVRPDWPMAALSKASQVQGSAGIPERNGGHANGCPPISCMRTRSPCDFQTASPKHVFASLACCPPGRPTGLRPPPCDAGSIGSFRRQRAPARPERAHRYGEVGGHGGARFIKIFFPEAMNRSPCRDVGKYGQPPGHRPARRQTRRRACPAEGGLVDYCVVRLVRAFAKAGAAGCVQAS